MPNYAYNSIDFDKCARAQDCCVLHRESFQNGINSGWWIAVYEFIPNVRIRRAFWLSLRVLVGLLQKLLSESLHGSLITIFHGNVVF